MILMVTTARTPGGVWRHVCDVTSELRARDVSVEVVLARDAVELRREARNRGIALRGLGRYPRGATCHFHLADTYDVAMLREMVLARLAGCVLVVTEHLPRTDASDSSLTHHRHRRASWLAKTILKTLQFRLVDATVAVSESSARFLALRYGRGVAEIDVVRNGVDPDDGRDEPAAGAEVPVVTAAGSMIRQKGFDVLVRAVASSRQPWTLALAGSGPHLESYRALAHSLGVAERVEFLGWQASARTVFRAGSVVAIPSRWEAAPYVVLEAMGEARPVVAARFDGVEEAVVDGETGLLVPVDDPERLAAAIDELVTSPERAREMGRAGRRHSLRFGLAHMVDGLQRVYERGRRTLPHGTPPTPIGHEMKD